MTVYKIHIVCPNCEEHEYLDFKLIDCMYNEDWVCKGCDEKNIPYFAGVFEHQVEVEE